MRPADHEDYPSLRRAAVICIFTLVLVKLSATLLLRKQRGKTGPHPPGPPSLPLIGNLHQLIRRRALPHHTISKLSAKYGPVMRLHLGECYAVVISSPETAKEVLGTKELSFAQRPEVFAVDTISYHRSSFLFAPYGDYWRRLRKMFVSELLSAKRVGSFRSIREEEVWDLVDAVRAVTGSPSSAVNVSEMIFLATNNVTARSAFGTRCKDSGEFLFLLRQVTEIGGRFYLPDLYPSLKFLVRVTGMQAELEQIHRGVDRIMEDIVTQHVARAGGHVGHQDDDEDLLDVLIKLQDSDDVNLKLTTDQIKALTLDVISAGSETSATTIEWAMAELMKNPTTMEKAQIELRQALKGTTKIEENDLHHHSLSYLKAIIKETLRLHPPAPLIPRESIDSCEVGGYQIPPKAKILINAYKIGRDPEIWSEPNRFRPERFIGSTMDFIGSNFGLIPFGGGRRICPGISFATAYIELVLAQMLYHFDWSLPQGMKVEELDMTERYSISAKKKENLYLVPTVYIPFSAQ